MRKRLLIAWIGIPAIGLTTTVVALTTNIVAAPFDYLRSVFSRPELGPELHLITPNGGYVISRTATGTNVEIFGNK
jgi:hypothetical protein